MLLSVMLCTNLAGHLLKAFILHPTTSAEGHGTISMLKDSKRHMDNVVLRTTSKGYMTTESFILWLEHVRREVQHRQRLVILVDNHRTHTSAEVQRYARSLNMVLVYLPANTTHALQPMDQYNQRLNYFRTVAFQSVTSGVMTKMTQELGLEVVLSALELLAAVPCREIIAAWRACGITKEGFFMNLLRQRPRDDKPENRRISFGSDDSGDSILNLSSQTSQPLSPKRAKLVIHKMHVLHDERRAANQLAYVQQQAEVAGRYTGVVSNVNSMKSNKLRVQMGANGTASGPEVEAALAKQAAKVAKKAAETAKQQEDAALTAWLSGYGIVVPDGKLQLPVLRHAAGQLDLDNRGSKPVLRQRLMDAMESEQGGAAAGPERGSESEEEDGEIEEGTEAAAATAVAPDEAIVPQEAHESEATDEDDESDTPAELDGAAVEVDDALLTKVLAGLSESQKVYWQQMIQRV